MPEEEAPLAEDHPVLGKMFTLDQLHTDFRNVFAIPKSILDDLEAHLRELEELKKQQAIGEVQQEIHGRMSRLLTLVPRGIAALKRIVGNIVDYRRHLIATFQRFDCDDMDMVQRIERSHPARKQLSQLSRKLAKLGKEEELDFHRISLLLIKALQLASAKEKPDMLDRVNVQTLVYDKLWKKRVDENRVLMERVLQDEPPPREDTAA